MDICTVWTEEEPVAGNPVKNVYFRLEIEVCPDGLWNNVGEGMVFRLLPADDVSFYEFGYKAVILRDGLQCIFFFLLFKE